MSRQQQDTLEQERYEMEHTMKVYEAICAVMNDISKEGIAKAHRNAQQGYNFRGIDDVYSALSPLLAKHRLLILPRVTDQTVVERTTNAGKPLFYTTVKMEFDFISAEDGSKHTVGPMVGEAMDSADKSSNKAQSAAYKYAAFQAFCIPTAGDNDADATTPQVEAQEVKTDEALAADALKSAESPTIVARRWTNIAKLFKSDPETLQKLTAVKDERLRQLEPA